MFDKNTNMSGDLMIELLNFILENPKFTIDDLNYNFYLSKEVVLKYFKTLKILGYKISKLNQKTYNLDFVPFQIDVTDDERIMLSEILFGVQDFYFKNGQKISFELLNKLKLFIDVKNLEGNLSNDNNFDYKLKKIFDLCRNLITDNQNIKIEYIDENNKIETLYAEPFDIVYHKSQNYFSVFDILTGENRLINFEFIKKITQSPKRSRNSGKIQRAKIKLKDKLAKSYTIRPKDEILQKEEDFIIVSTIYNDRNLFFKRVLRYGEKCEIIYPKSLKFAFCDYLQQMISNYN